VELALAPAVRRAAGGRLQGHGSAGGIHRRPHLTLNSARVTRHKGEVGLLCSARPTELAMARRAERERLDIARRHARLGYGVLLLSALLGLTLEALHAFKVSAYLDASTRRLMWRLAHAHGALLGLV